MPTIINNPSGGEESSAVNVIIVVITVLALGALFIFYGLPTIRESMLKAQQPNTTNINIATPTPIENTTAPLIDPKDTSITE